MRHAPCCATVKHVAELLALRRLTQLAVVVFVMAAMVVVGHALGMSKELATFFGIGVGAALVASFSWILYVFGVFLVFTGLKMFARQDHATDIEKSLVLKWIRKHFRVSRQLHGEQFLVRLPDAKSGKLQWFMTPLLVALILVEFIDLVFAVDSVPAVFAITQDPFIVYNSNIFAFLGLRSLYFALAAAMNRFKYLQISLAIVLVLVGCKIFLVPLGIKVDTLLSLVITVGILASGVIYSLWRTRNDGAATP